MAEPLEPRPLPGTLPFWGPRLGQVDRCSIALGDQYPGRMPIDAVELEIYLPQAAVLGRPVPLLVLSPDAPSDNDPGCVAPGLVQRVGDELEQAWLSGRCGEMALVAPIRLLGRSTDHSELSSAWRTVLHDRLVPHLEQAYPVGRARGRALLGIGLGAELAFRAALDRPAYWSCVSCSWLRTDFDRGLRKALLRSTLARSSANHADYRQRSEMAELWTRARGYAEDEKNSPPRLPLAYDAQFGARIDEESFARWRKHDPLQLATSLPILEGRPPIRLEYAERGQPEDRDGLWQLLHHLARARWPYTAIGSRQRSGDAPVKAVARSFEFVARALALLDELDC